MSSMWERVVLIFLLETLYVTVMTCRWIILVRGYRYVSSMISFFEQIVYVTALSLVVTQLNDPYRILAFAAGYAAGSILGSWLETKIAIGYVVFQVVTSPSSRIGDYLRGMGFGVTVWRGMGRDNERQLMMVVTKRKSVHKVMNTIDTMDSDAFVIGLDLQNLRKGFFASGLSIPDTKMT